MTITERIEKIRQLIAATAEACQRSPEEIQLLAVSKGQPASAIQEAYTAGIRNIGENYLQEAQTKIHALKNLSLCWHFIGPIQSNKTQAIAETFSWVHSIDREKIAKLLSQHRPDHLPALNICLQVNLDEEDSKSGLAPEQLKQLALLVTELPRLNLRGLMTIPKPRSDEQQQYESLLRLTKLFNQLNQELNLSMDSLSMGMTDDLVAAIRAGSTMVRIGRAIFGERQ
ncbi:pyridoxal-5'-phosphate dependent enzyme family transporter protein [Legionella nautarum]|uniref:Pyridoxal phosphate homeostasis protein n=1 Tax=Legionella nautarum TaxID=45070 RepID=A0A0W0WL08_9GAMM|nr:YggS family pyridoxal phosphate-dependent enzyme [Legionella nautarum]KTD32999.1 pyridoxal-5'-phosphate dependent enzyme family transporter protein [Legionella nautarum]